MSNRFKPWKGRARGARVADDLFEQALRGDDHSPTKKFDPTNDRKTLQLCRQVQHALMLALAGECADDLLRELSIDSVQPAGGGGHLLVRVLVPRDFSVTDVLSRLNDRTPKLRSIIAASICRKRVPMLTFIPAAEAGQIHQPRTKMGGDPLFVRPELNRGESNG